MTYKVIDFAGQIAPKEFDNKDAALAHEALLHGEHGFGNKGLPRFAVMYEVEAPTASEKGTYGFDFQTGPNADPEAVVKLQESLK